MPRATQNTLRDSQIVTGARVTKSAVATLNKFVRAVNAAEKAGQKTASVSIADLRKVAALLKQAVRNAGTSDGTDFVQNDTDPGDPVRVGD